METTLTFLQDHPRYNEEKPVRRVGFLDRLMEWQSNYEYVDEEDSSVTNIRGYRNNLPLQQAGFQFLLHQCIYELNIEKFDTCSEEYDNPTAYLEETTRSENNA